MNKFIKAEKIYVDCHNKDASMLYCSDKKNINDTYKKMYVTYEYIKLKKIRCNVKKFFDTRIKNESLLISPKKIILIERKFNFKQKIDKSNQYNYSGNRRIIVNYRDLKNSLEIKYGDNFASICLDELDIFEQYNIFKNAKIIIGQHGAGLCNIYFSEANFKCTLIEIAPEWNIGNHWFENLAELCEINYERIEQERMTKKEWINFQDMANIVPPVIKDGDNIFNYSGPDYIEVKYIEPKISNLDKIYAYSKKCITEYPVLTFIRNSGSVNINKVKALIDNTIEKLDLFK